MVENSLYDGPRGGIRRQVFIPYYGNGSAAFYVRAAGSPASLYSALRGEVKKLDASMPVFQMQTLEAQLDRDAAHRTSDRDAFGRLRRAGDAAGLDRTLWRHGFRRRAPHEGDRTSAWRSARSRAPSSGSS